MAKRKGTRRQKRLERRAVREQQVQHEARLAEKRKWLLLGIALATALGAFGIYAAQLPRVLLGLILLLGCGAWLTIALGSLGGSVKRRDRNKAGNIDYGK